jgi:hypothetical protein
VDGQLGVIARGGFTWKRAGGFTQKSVAVDSLKPAARTGAMQLLSADEPETRAAAAVMEVNVSTTRIAVQVRDGAAGKDYQVRLSDEGLTWETAAE